MQWKPLIVSVLFCFGALLCMWRDDPHSALLCAGFAVILSFMGERGKG